MKDLKDYLNIQKPVSTNLIPFYNTSTLDRALSVELNNLLDDREITFGMLPDMEEKRKLYKDILDRIGGDIENFDFQLPLFENYEVYDPPGTSSHWQLTPFNSVIQGLEVDYDQPGKYQNLGTLLIGREDVGTSPKKLTANAKIGSKGEAGIIFNFKSYDDFWIFSYYNNPKKSDKLKNALVVRRVLFGFVTEYGRVIPKNYDLTNKMVDFKVEATGSDINAKVLEEGTTKEVGSIRIKNLKLLDEVKCGLYSQNNGDNEYFHFFVSYATGDDLVYPFNTDLLKLQNTTYEKDFDIYNVDLRPMSWLGTFKRLWAEKFFTKERLTLAEGIYSSLLEKNEEDAELLSVSPEDIDNAEGRVRKAFNDYLIAEDKFQEFATFMSEAGVIIPEESSSDDFKSVFSQSAPNSISTIEQEVKAATYTTWKEFYYTGAVIRKGVDFSSLISDEKREEILTKSGEAGWNLYVRNTIAPHTVKTVQKQVPHYRFVISHLGDKIETPEGECYIVGKYWKTNQTKESHEGSDGRSNFSIQISDVNAVSTTIKSIMSPGSAMDPNAQSIDIESDIREYKEINGALVDQYGVTIQDHVIRLTENYDEKINNVLIVPIYDTNESVRPDRVMVIKNPIFSGKQLHPISVQFHEKYSMDVRWEGVSLGEFSHSVNLFPGEEREIKMVATRKKSWETVSKSKTSTKASSSSESTQASKRNDSFSSKISDSMEKSSDFASSKSTKSKASVTVKASGGFGPFSASASASYSRDSSSESSSKMSSVSKKASELASQSGSEVSNNNKVAFSSTTDTESSLESKVSGEDMESETSTIKLYNINEGKTANYNFYQVTNVYNTAVSVENVSITIDTGIEIIPGTGLTVSKEFELEDFRKIYSEFFIYNEDEKKNLFKIVSAQIIQRYLKLDRDKIDDDPQILKVESGKATQDRLATLRAEVNKVLSKTLNTVALSTKKPADNLVDQLPDDLLDLREYEFEIVPFEVDSSNYYTINSGKYYVDAHLGHMPATEDYLEERRKIETDRQKALVNELKKRTEKGVFFPEFPENIQSLSIDGQEMILEGSNGTDKDSKR